MATMDPPGGGFESWRGLRPRDNDGGWRPDETYAQFKARANSDWDRNHMKRNWKRQSSPVSRIEFRTTDELLWRLTNGA